MKRFTKQARLAHIDKTKAVAVSNVTRNIF